TSGPRHVAARVAMGAGKGDRTGAPAISAGGMRASTAVPFGTRGLLPASLPGMSSLRDEGRIGAPAERRDQGEAAATEAVTSSGVQEAIGESGRPVGVGQGGEGMEAPTVAEGEDLGTGGEGGNEGAGPGAEGHEGGHGTEGERHG